MKKFTRVNYEIFSILNLLLGFFSTSDANWLILQRNSQSHRIIPHVEKSTSVVQYIQDASAAVDTPPTQPPSIKETRTYFFGKNATYNYDRTSLVKTQDITTLRANTLYDDADDIQRQLDNEAKDRLKNGKGASIWVFHFPTSHRWGGTTQEMRFRIRDERRLVKRHTSLERKTQKADDYKASLDYANHHKEWNYHTQGNWKELYPACGGGAQSPVNLPHALLKVTGGRQLSFRNHDVAAQHLTIANDGKEVKLTGVWESSKIPFIQGGAVHGRRYLFHSLCLHWPSEHTIATMHYPLESQALYVSVEYPTLEAAITATDDKMAMLAVSNIYTVSNHTDPGLAVLLKAATNPVVGGVSLSNNYSLSFFNPPFKEYASYQGSLTRPPCTESVVWMVRGRSLSVTKELFWAAQKTTVNGELLKNFYREAQPLNDRSVYFFK